MSDKMTRVVAIDVEAAAKAIKDQLLPGSHDSVRGRIVDLLRRREAAEAATPNAAGQQNPFPKPNFVTPTEADIAKAIEWGKSEEGQRIIAEAKAQALAAEPQPSVPLNLDHDEARALHRIVRAMHDGECPKCHSIIPSDQMRRRFAEAHPPVPKLGVQFVTHIARQGTKCPACGFEIDDSDAREVLQIFAPFMERNLAVFEKWRAERNKAQCDQSSETLSRG